MVNLIAVAVDPVESVLLLFLLSPKVVVSPSAAQLPHILS